MVSCSITNLGTCLPQKFFEFILSLLNTPIQILLDFNKNLLVQEVNLNLFASLWVVIVYIISLFYGLFFMFIGFNFIVSGYNYEKRENAKSWLTNIILMVLFVQASFFLYELTVKISSLLSKGVFEMIDPSFFVLNSGNLTSLGFQLTLLVGYLLILLATSILLSLRYLLVSVGIVFIPIGIFFYFIPPLQNYGKMIINVLMVIVFIPFFDAIILLGSSMLSEMSTFHDFNIIAASAGFITIDLLMIFLIFFAMVKAAFSASRSDMGRAVKMGVNYFS